MQSGFCFKSKTPVGKNLIMKAFFKGLWQRTHEKTGKREFELQKDTALRGDSPRAACAHAGCGADTSPQHPHCPPEQCPSEAPRRPLLPLPSKKNELIDTASVQRTNSFPHIPAPGQQQQQAPRHSMR